MGLGQPDVQGIHARFGAEAHQAAASGSVKRSPLFRRQSRRSPGQLIQGQRSQKMLQKQDARQQNHTADHCHRQVSLRCPQSLSRLVLGHPHIGGHGHHLKKDEQGKEIPCQEHAHEGPLRQQPEKVIPAAPLCRGKIGWACQAGGAPQQGRYQRQQRLQGARLQREAHTTHMGQRHACSRHQQQAERCRELHSGYNLDPEVASLSAAVAQRPYGKGRRHGKQNEKNQQEPFHDSPPLHNAPAHQLQKADDLIGAKRQHHTGRR